MRCEDYPCCGHTPADPCEPQWYDTAAGKAQIMRHACCDHDAGYCEIEPPEPECDVCHEYECDVDEWCGGCGCCVAHCQEFVDCPERN